MSVQISPAAQFEFRRSNGDRGSVEIAKFTRFPEIGTSCNSQEKKQARGK